MITYKKIFAVFLIMLSSVNSAFAETPVNTLSQLLKNMRSMQANFVQTILDKHGKAIQTASGKMALQRPSQFRWNTLDPNRQLIVTNGKRLWIYDPDLDQVTIRSLSKAAGETPAMLLSDETLTLDKDFIVSPSESKDSMQWFKLIPKDKGSLVSTLRLGFSNGVIQQMIIEDHLGHTTRIRFSNVITNAAINKSQFAFTPPANVDVIDETKR